MNINGNCPLCKQQEEDLIIFLKPMAKDVWSSITMNCPNQNNSDLNIIN